MSSPLLFLSHAGSDSDAALKLAEQIEATPAAIQAKLKVWIDKRCLRPGTPWQQQLEDAIEHHSTAFAIYLSDAGAEHWVRMEVRAALDRVIANGHDGKAYPFIPVLAHSARDVARLPLFARQYQGIDLGSSSALADLVAAATVAAGRDRSPLVAEPFLGLESFGSDAAHLFFGRSRETQELLERLKTTPLLFVVGDSGSGKSSVVMAGVVPAFREGMLADPMVPRPGPGAWHVVQMRPGRDPIQSLIDAVANAAREVPGLNAQLLDAAFGRLRGQSGAPGDPAAALDMLREGSQIGARCLLFVDQFEELWSQTLDDGRRRVFIEALLKLIKSGDERCRVIATIRRDYAFQLASNELLRDHLRAMPFEGRYNLRRMDEAALRDCVEKPLALAGVAPNQAKALADEVLRDAGDEPGQLALLEVALFKTWEQRGAHPTLLDAYKAIGRIEGALSRAADQALERLVTEYANGRQAAETIFVRLVMQSADGTVVRRRARREEFEPGVWQVAQALGKREFNRLLVLGLQDEVRLTPAALPSTVDSVASNSSSESALTAELAHEQIATQWDQYRLWLKRDASVEEDKRALDRLMLRAGEWTEQGQRFWEATTSGLERLSFGHLSHRRPQWLSRSEISFLRTARRRLRAPIAGIVVVAFLAGAGNWLSLEHQRVEAQATLLWNGLELNGDLSQRDIETSLQLAAADSDIKMRFAEMFIGDPALAERFLRMPRLVAVALAGRMPQVRNNLIELVVSGSTEGQGPSQLQALALLGSELQTPAAVEPLLQAIKATKDPDGLRALARGLHAVPAKLDAAQSARAVEPLLQAIEATSDPKDLKALAQGLQAVPAELDAAQSARAVEQLLQAIKPATSSFQLKALAEGLQTVPAKLDAAQSARAVESLLQAIKATTHPVEIIGLGQVLQVVAAKLDAAQSARAVEPLLRAIKATTNPYRLIALANGLQAMAARLDAAQSARAVEWLLQAIKATTEPVALKALARGLQAVPAELDAAQSARAVEPLLQAIKATTDPDDLGALAQGLQAVPVKLDAAQSARAVEPLLQAIMAKTDPDDLNALGQGLQAVAAKLDAAQAARAVESLLQAIEATTDPFRQRALAQGLKAVPAKLDAAQSARAVEPLLQAIKAKTDPDGLNALGQGLQAVAAKLDAAQAARAVEPLLQAIKATTDLDDLDALAQGLQAVAAKLDAAQSARSLAQLLANPLLSARTADAVVESIRVRPPSGLGTNATLWDILAWSSAQR